MKRDVVKDYINNPDLGVDERVNGILNEHSRAIGAHLSRISDLEAKNQELQGIVDSRQDYESVQNELATLRAEKADREMTDRFNTVVGNKKFKNAFTFDGVKKGFAEAVALEENQGKTDEEIWADYSKDKENEWFDSPYRVSMTPSAGRVNVDDNPQSYIAEKFKNNPWYGK